ncbi:MAG TPA: alpha-D-glucose phosphate-specific phosphoglucomutase, partial [Dyella sp.]|nr:alpha-D-glucose phosphate-specific phosphoglucomutase [Dyella sp.]
MSPILSPLAGKPAPASILVDVPQLLAAYADLAPDPSVPAQRVAFGTSGHRGSSLGRSFNAAHVLAISQAICDYRAMKGIDGPLFVAIDTHALSAPAFEHALEVFAANEVTCMVSVGTPYTPTPVLSHAILVYNRSRTDHLADGIVLSPSHNPPADGGYKYNPPNGGPADTDVTRWIQDRANALLEGGLREVRRVPYAQARRSSRVIEHDYVSSYVSDLAHIVDFDLIRAGGLRL